MLSGPQEAAQPAKDASANPMHLLRGTVSWLRRILFRGRSKFSTYSTDHYDATCIPNRNCEPSSNLQRGGKRHRSANLPMAKQWHSYCRCN